jgi:hypothetical protein
MSDWPDTLKCAPVRVWPGELTRTRTRSQFKAGLRDTLQLLDRELFHLTETHTQRESLEMLIAIPAGDAWRLDGRPRANAVPEHPGVIVSLDSKFGHLSYPCDTFTTWQDNLRAVALALEALRKVDRYGVTKRGEQYPAPGGDRRWAVAGGRRAIFAAFGLGKSVMQLEIGAAHPRATPAAAAA